MRDVLLGRVARSQLRGALAIGALGGVIVLSSVAGYATAYPHSIDRLALQAGLGSNAGIAALFGKPRTLETIGGFVAWRSLGVLAIVGGIWGALLGARIFRGEEESGRLELALAGPRTRRRACLSLCGAAALALLTVWTAIALSALAGSGVGSGYSGPGALYLATVLTAPAALFTAVGALAGQLCPTRRAAAASAGAVFGVLFAARMAVGAGRWTWLAAADPLVRLDRADALAGARPTQLLPVLAEMVIVAAAAVVLAGRRDLGAATLPFGTYARRHVARIGGPGQLAARTVAGSAAGWLAALGALAAVVATLAAPVAEAVQRSAGIRRIFGQLAGNSGAQPRNFVGVTMATIATGVALLAASCAVALREEEASGRLETMLAAPLGRARWFTTRLYAASGAVVACGLTIGLALWCAGRPAGMGVPLRTLVSAGLNLAPTALVVLAVGALLFAIRPRWTAAVTYGLVAWSFTVELVGSLIHAPRLVLDTSLLHHVALAPAVAVDVRGDVVLVALAVVTSVVAVVAFNRRDLIGA